MNDPIIDAALRDLESTSEQIGTAEVLIKILREAGEDVAEQSAHLGQLRARREKLMVSLRNNGAKTP